MTVRVVLFDVMDTLLADPYREALAAATSVPLEELVQRRGPQLWPAFERGELTEEQYWAAWAEAGIAFDAEAFHATRRAGTRWLPGMAALLDALDGVVERVTASNYPVWIEELAEVHLAGRIDRVLASHHLGVRKPEPAFYERLLERVEVAPHEALFVDDRADNVAAAEAIGIVSHRFTDAPKLWTWLVHRGVASEADVRAPGSDGPRGSGHP